MVDKWAKWRLGTMETKISRSGRNAGRGRMTSWDVTFAVGLTVACILSYEAITLLILHRVSRGNDFLGGMWTVVATVYVFRGGSGGIGDGGRVNALGRLVATCVSILLCFLYLVVFPFTAIGTACLIGFGAVVLTLNGQQEDIVTMGITTAVVMYVAGLDPDHAWHQPLLRALDTVVGVTVGIACKWLVLVLFFRFIEGDRPPLVEGAMSKTGSTHNAQNDCTLKSGDVDEATYNKVMDPHGMVGQGVRRLSAAGLFVIGSLHKAGR